MTTTLATASTLQFLPLPHAVTGDAVDVGTETRWTVRLADGRIAVVGQLAPDLARDESIRRRWVRDIERVRTLPAHSLAPTLAIGPQPDPRVVGPVAPWRLRLEPTGERLSAILTRAPLPIDEAAILFAAIADAVHAVHRCGAVLRDLRPEQIVRTDEGHIVLVDVGLARVDVLSSHTASSLLLRGSTYAAPEQLVRTAVDQRSDVWSLGMMLWQALTGALPFGDGPALLADHQSLPSIERLRADAPAALEALLRRCLSVDPGGRPGSVSEIAWVLRGGETPWDDSESASCQHCGARLRVGQRLCTGCGRVAVRFEHAPEGEPAFALDLLDLNEEAEPLRWLQNTIGDVSEHPIRRPEFVIGSIHMYSEEERVQRIRLPARLYNRLTQDTALSLQQLAKENGVRTRIVRPEALKKAWLLVGSTVGVTSLLALLFALVGLSPWWMLAPGLVSMFAGLALVNERVSRERVPPHYRLRPMPAALPASDPLVARLAALLAAHPPSDVRSVIGELALLVQRLVDHRARLLGPEAKEVAMLTAPVEPIVAAVERLVADLRDASRELGELDEGAMVRALAACDARGDGDAVRLPILEGLDRLRTLEDRRAELFHRLLESKSLLERTVRMGLAVHDPAGEQARQVALALATLTR
ncbi:MAG: serine/threonine protein kinase [Deltaproteobacteria bacterium]|nr:serine/threonine protein kinase [Deltaproteobacteria bacterium]